MRIELYKQTIQTYMTWDESNKHCVNLGDDWRSPTKDELFNTGKRWELI